jgi:hypothetical protein
MSTDIVDYQSALMACRQTFADVLSYLSFGDIDKAVALIQEAIREMDEGD